jgi:tetratricopeptide (TPR) repeat protein
VTRALLALAAAALATSLRAQEPPSPEAALPDLPADAGLSLPGLDPERSRALAEALRAGTYDRAEKLLVESAHGGATSPELLRLLGSVSFLTGNYLNAAVALKKAERLAPLDERGRFTLAMSYVVLGRHEWARPELRTLAERAPANALYPYWTARLDYEAGRYADAVSGLQRAIAIAPGFVKAYDNLGLCYEGLGRYPEAMASHEQAVRLNREAASPSAWPPHNLGLLLTRLDRTAEAEPLFREALRYDTGFAPAHYQLGVALEKMDRPAEATSALQEAARLDPKYPDPHYALARIHRRQNRVADADRALALFQRLKNEKRRAGPTRVR